MKNNWYEIRNYHRKSLFSDFLPGINGVDGIPMWCFYVNRGQCIASFGVEDKDHSIVEFYPAHQAYQRVQNMGFRSLIKMDGVFGEAFAEDQMERTMRIGNNGIEIEEINTRLNLSICITYTTLPEEPLSGLNRRVCIKNLSDQTVHMELADGMTEIMPYGVDLDSMKNMAQTSKAWSEVKGQEEGIPRFAVRAGMQDTAKVEKVDGFHYAFAISNGHRLPVIVNRRNLFGYDSAFRVPSHFQNTSVNELMMETQITQNDFFGAFFLMDRTLKPQEEIVVNEVYGEGHVLEQLETLVCDAKEADFFEHKAQRSEELVSALTDPVKSSSGAPRFDEYARTTYLDNVLRGGTPISLGDKVFYTYSRKHGDLERDYNYFRLSREPYSQGNGNFRDVNQNRRSDVLFHPFVGTYNIHLFYNCIQLDGYNPLGIEKQTYWLKESTWVSLKEELAEKEELDTEAVNGLDDMFGGYFTPGEVYQKLFDNGVEKKTIQRILPLIMNAAKTGTYSNYLEGYWTDHWTYNLDLIENYLAVFPEKEESVLYEDHSYVWQTPGAKVLERGKRYEKTEDGIRQYHAVEELEKTTQEVRDSQNRSVHATLYEKILLLCVTKTATLDPYGMGVEMEGGKPGWYDALNGLPGIFGSSMNETYELIRNIRYLKQLNARYGHSVEVADELVVFIEEVIEVLISDQTVWSQQMELTPVWNNINEVKERYRGKIYQGISGVKRTLEARYLDRILTVFEQYVAAGIEKAVKKNSGMIPTYYYYEVCEYKETEDGMIPIKFRQQKMPDFLEGTVHYLKLAEGQRCKETIYQELKKSDLYDEKLQMYKVNASLKDTSVEIGRARIFTPGWLENESIWLHMEYKYLLELLKNEMYEQFAEDFHKAGVPFLEEETYGRSLFQNSSFIASSANPDSSVHGKGFVARLSGSTAEFLQMWQIMMFGKNPFTWDGKQLNLEFAPYIPTYIMGTQKSIQVMFLGTILVTYEIERIGHDGLIPGFYQIRSYEIFKEDGITIVEGPAVTGKLAEEIRSGKVKKIKVRI